MPPPTFPIQRAGIPTLQKRRLAAIVGMRRIEQVIRDLLALDNQLVRIGQFQFVLRLVNTTPEIKTSSPTFSARMFSSVKGQCRYTGGQPFGSRP